MRTERTTITTSRDPGELGRRLGDALRRRGDELCDVAAMERGLRPIDVRAEIEGTAGFLERELALLGEDVASRQPICADDEWAALMLPSNVTALAAGNIAVQLAAGNRVVARMTSRATASAAVIQDMFDEVSPDAVVMERSASGPDFLERILTEDAISLAIVYGGEPLGDELLSRARESALLKRVVYEGPGKDPVIVLEGASIDVVAEAVVAAKFVLAGQTCVAPENILVHRTLHDPLVTRLVTACERAVVGDPRDPSTEIGPMVSPRVPPIVRRLLTGAQCLGARIACGGEIEGQWVHPTVVKGVTPEMALFQEETFGPVLAVASFDEPAEAVELARAGRFGLSCMVFGPRAEAVAAELRGQPYAHPVDDLVYGRYGHVSVNRGLGPPTLRRPFGGYGKSGWIWDFDGLRQGPKSLAWEATVGA